jgi:aldose 1-epimerase
MSVKGKTQQLDVLLGPNYRSLVLYSPNPANARGGGGGRGGAPAPAPPPSTPAAPSVPLSAPRDTVSNRGFIAFEPMVGITDSMNLAHKGLYKELQSIPPGGKWEESFWLRPTGF